MVVQVVEEGLDAAKSKSGSAAADIESVPLKVQSLQRRSMLHRVEFLLSRSDR